MCDLCKATPGDQGMVTEYKGTCDGCGGRMDFGGEVIVATFVEHLNDGLIHYAEPMGILYCPTCGALIHGLNLYCLDKLGGIDVTEELKGIDRK